MLPESELEVKGECESQHIKLFPLLNFFKIVLMWTIFKVWCAAVHGITKSQTRLSD